MAENTKVGAMISKVNMGKLQAAHDALTELGVQCGEPSEEKNTRIFPLNIDPVKMYEMTPQEYAMSESWNIVDACSALMQIANLSRAEVAEPNDISKLASIMRGLVDFINGQINELETAALQPAKSFAIPKELDLSYVKSLGVTNAPKGIAVKYIAKDEIKGYTFLWGNAGLTDVEIEYFTNTTDFWDSRLGKSSRPLTWDHAQDKDFKASPVIGEITDFGDDELGRWYVAKLDTSHKYRKVIDQLIKDGVLGTSSDSAPQYVVREKTGKSIWLKEWPWFASALTNTPAEPRMIGSLEFLKSLGVQLPDVSAIRSRQKQRDRELQYLNLKSKE